LVKGASGQAIQNMNLLYNFPKELGLKWKVFYSL
jgi:N-acetyl-gamma-glutamylphosphate reductase